MERDRGLGRPDQKPKSQNNAQLKEAGKPSPGFPTLKPEQSPHGGGIKNPERQAIPSVWDVLERRVKLSAEFNAGHRTYEEYDRERHELNKLSNEIFDKRTPSEKLILRLHTVTNLEPSGTLPLPAYIRTPSLEAFQQFRSKVEPMPEEEIREEIRKAEEEYKRKDDEITRKRGGGGKPPPFTLALP